MLLFLLLLGPGDRLGAQPAWVDTLRYSLHQRPKFYFQLASFNSFVSSDFANFSGFRMGLNYNHRLRFGMGLLTLDGNAVVSAVTIEEGNIRYITNGQLRTTFLTFIGEYIFYTRYPWQFTVLPVQAGIGGAHYEYNSRLDTNRRVSTPDEFLFILQPEVTGQYNIVRWIGVTASVGYRFTAYSSRELREDFNAPAFSAGVKIFIDEIYKSLFPNGVFRKKRTAPMEEWER
jgi:hypothetical protein